MKKKYENKDLNTAYNHGYREGTVKKRIQEFIDGYKSGIFDTKKKILDKIYKTSFIEHLTKEQQKELKECLK